MKQKNQIFDREDLLKFLSPFHTNYTGNFRRQRDIIIKGKAEENNKIGNVISKIKMELSEISSSIRKSEESLETLRKSSITYMKSKEYSNFVKVLDEGERRHRRKSVNENNHQRKGNQKMLEILKEKSKHLEQERNYIMTKLNEILKSREHLRTNNNNNMNNAIDAIIPNILNEKNTLKRKSSQISKQLLCEKEIEINLLPSKEAEHVEYSKEKDINKKKENLFRDLEISFIENTLMKGKLDEMKKLNIEKDIIITDLKEKIKVLEHTNK